MVIKRLSVVVFGLFLASGCTSFWQGGGAFRNGSSSSLVDYLYPEGEVPPSVSSSVPHLQLPLRVGVAFVPGRGYHSGFSEATKMQLLENVKQEFAGRQYIEHIEIIPDTYLQSSYGIEGMQQVARLYGVDVMALVSYDQVNVTEDNTASLLYWTIVGAYIIQGTDNEVQTFVDTAVFDVATARLLFRAPGINKASDRVTAIKADESLRKGSEASFIAAVEDMSGNLQTELDRFRERVKENPDVASVEWKPSHGGGGGAFGVLLLLTLSLLAVYSRSAGPIGVDNNCSKRSQRVSRSALSASTKSRTNSLP